MGTMDPGWERNPGICIQKLLHFHVSWAQTAVSWQGSGEKGLWKHTVYSPANPSKQIECVCGLRGDSKGCPCHMRDKHWGLIVLLPIGSFPYSALPLVCLPGETLLFQLKNGVVNPSQGFFLMGVINYWSFLCLWSVKELFVVHTHGIRGFKFLCTQISGTSQFWGLLLQHHSDC